MFSYQPLQLHFPFFIPCVRHPGLVYAGPQTACLSADFCTNAHQQAQHGPKNWVVADSDSDPPFVLDLNSSSRLLSIRP